VLLLLWVNLHTLKNFELISEILETRLENQLDEVARSVLRLSGFLETQCSTGTSRTNKQRNSVSCLLISSLRSRSRSREIAEAEYSFKPTEHTSAAVI